MAAMRGAACPNLPGIPTLKEFFPQPQQRIQNGLPTGFPFGGDVNLEDAFVGQLDGQNRAQSPVVRHGQLLCVVGGSLFQIIFQRLIAAPVAVKTLPALRPLPGARHRGQEFPFVFGIERVDGQGVIFFQTAAPVLASRQTYKSSSAVSSH